MISIRRNVFETNSSSTHSITMCTQSDFDKWKNGELYWDRWGQKFITKEEYEAKMNQLRGEFIAENPDFDENDEEWLEEFNEYINDDKCYYTYEEFNDYDYLEYEHYEKTFETPTGEKVVSFGYFGNDY